MTRASRRGRAVPVRRPSTGTGAGWVVIVLVLLILAGLGVLGVQLYRHIYLPVQDAARRIIATRPPVTGTPAPTPNPLKDPINILLIGVDRREGDESTRNDVNIVVHVDPVRRFASMLSIPRDTRVYIPGHGAYKINAAYSLGELYHEAEGGGPVWAKRTVEQFLGMRIDYYAEVDFRGFERIVDLVGGITVDVPWPLLDNEYPTEDYGYMRIYIPAGLQHMDGRTALQYARSRHADSDLGRNRRQQQVLLALRERILRMDLLTDLNRMDALFQQLGDTLETDMSLDTIYALARLAPKIDRENIASYALDWTVLSEISGTTDLEPCMPCVAQIVQEMQMDPVVRRLKEEGARIEVRNGTWVPDLAKNTANYLRGHGFNVVSILQDNRAGHYTHTLVLDNLDLPFTREQLVQQLHTDPAYAFVFPDYAQLGIQPPEGADILVILGDDYQLPQE